MQRGQVCQHGDGLLAALDEDVTLDRREEIKQTPRRRPSAVAAFRVEGQGFDSFAFHRHADFPFQERFNQQGEEIDTQMPQCGRCP